MSRFFEVIGWLLIAAVYILCSYLLSDYTNSDYSYWIRVIWCGIVLTLMYVAVTLFNYKARVQNYNTPLYIAFAVKMCICGLLSIGICIRSYFFDATWMQAINVVSQGVIFIYLIIISTGFLSVGLLEANSKETLKSRKVFLEECEQLFIDIESNITTDNIILFKRVKELFSKSILVVNNDTHLTRLNNIKSLLMQITSNINNTQQQQILMNTINNINGFYR